MTKSVPLEGLVEVEYGGSAGILVSDGSDGSPWPYTQREIDRDFTALPDDLTIRRKVPGSYNDWVAEPWGEIKKYPGIRFSLAWTPKDLQEAKEENDLLYVVSEAHAYLPAEDGASLEYLEPIEDNYDPEKDNLCPAPVILVFHPKAASRDSTLS
ncbi:MAG: hypothetical protein L0K56_02530 [Corynebacterium sp.]|nr:hypothetical protein [Corynebacterium sp.]MDN6509568.1 hypothetical protein [Corynebacterium sp.]